LSAAFAAASRKNRIMHELFFVVKQLVEFHKNFISTNSPAHALLTGHE